MEQVHNPEEVAAGEDGSRLLLRFLLPSALCGVLIGRGGATIRNYGEASPFLLLLDPDTAVPVD